tara:strand:- start:16541 stop:17662 length:1122 start_codon:yes stop_codon:yes gene_type:complete
MATTSPFHNSAIVESNNGNDVVNPVHDGRSGEPSNDGDTDEGNTGSNNQTGKSKSILSLLNPFPSMSKIANNIMNYGRGYAPMSDGSTTVSTTVSTDGESDVEPANNGIFWFLSPFISPSGNGDAVVEGDVPAVQGNVSVVVPPDVSADESGNVPAAPQSSVLTRLASVPGAMFNGIASVASSSPTSRIIGFKPLLLQGPSLQYVFLLLLFVILIIYFITYVVYIKSNWEDVKCREGRFWLAPLFGKDTDETIRDCTSRQIQISIDNNLEAENTRMGEIEQMVRDLSNNVTEYSGDSLALGEGAEGEMSNITDTLQHNVNYVKEALSTILASIWISTQMNNGALTSYSDLQSSEISNIIDKYNNVDGNFNTYQ